MPVIKSGSSSFKPYARIMGIIGDQLITDKLVALVEIVKNSYDADARKVTIKFNNWVARPGHTLPIQEPSVEIIDNGNGMNEDVLLHIFLNPGTPNKLLQKKEDRKTPVLHRTMQGEKGIGRFAINKLGHGITIYSKTATDPEVRLTINFEEYDDETKTDVEDYKLLSEVVNQYVINDPPLALKEGTGTIIKIEKLKQTWTKKDFDALISSLQKLTAPPDILRKEYYAKDYSIISDFEFVLEINDTPYQKPVDLWESVLKMAPFQMIGTISSEGVLSYKYKATEPFRKRTVDKTIDLLDFKSYNFQAPDVKKRFIGKEEEEYISAKKVIEIDEIDDDADDEGGNTAGELKKLREPQQGDISFSFYVYDFSLERREMMLLNKLQQDFVKSHSVFVFRDGIRVYPFGEKGYDWLELSRRRAQVKAGWYYSDSQIIGFVYIKGKANPKLKDTTSRYGLMDIDGAYDDFQALLVGTLNAMKVESDFDITEGNRLRNQSTASTASKLDKAYKTLTKEVQKTGNDKLIESVEEFKTSFEKNSVLLKERLETYEDLAGLGLAVEKSSHDAIMILKRTFGTIEDLRTQLRSDDALTKRLNELIDELKLNVDIVYNEMQVIQPLFRISRRTQVAVDIKEVAEKTIRYFRHELSLGIKANIETTGPPLQINATQGIILQVLINLLDNAIYWLREKGGKEKEILIRINGDDSTVLVSDNGIGISEELSDVVFEAFLSRKDSGRGLGLYITRELLARMGASIRLVYKGADHVLPGANFLIQFEK